MSTLTIEQPVEQKTAPLTVTEKAATAIKRTIADELASSSSQAKFYLRVKVIGGGCSGFQNKLDLVTEVNEKLDEVFEMHGVPVVVDKRSLMYLDGATIDFHDDLNRHGFSVTNPHAKSHCGCGSSFSM